MQTKKPSCRINPLIQFKTEDPVTFHLNTRVVYTDQTFFFCVDGSCICLQCERRRHTHRYKRNVSCDSSFVVCCKVRVALVWFLQNWGSCWTWFIELWFVRAGGPAVDQNSPTQTLFMDVVLVLVSVSDVLFVFLTCFLELSSAPENKLSTNGSCASRIQNRIRLHTLFNSLSCLNVVVFDLWFAGDFLPVNSVFGCQAAVWTRHLKMSL